MPEARPGTILLVEDEQSDVALLRRAFDTVHLLNPVVHLANGDEALAYLAGAGQYTDRNTYPLPVLVLLDLKLPGMSGLQLLQWIRSRRDVRRIPVVVLTMDEGSATINAAYDAGANSYLVKPGDSQQVLRMVETIQRYWLNLNEPPQLVMRAEK